jgi:hypothetical protein
MRKGKSNGQDGHARSSARDRAESTERRGGCGKFFYFFYYAERGCEATPF